MTVSHGCRETSHAEDHTDSLCETVDKRDGSAVRGTCAHIVPGNADIYKDARDGEERQGQSLFPVSASSRAAEIFSHREKQDK